MIALVFEDLRHSIPIDILRARKFGGGYAELFMLPAEFSDLGIGEKCIWSLFASVVGSWWLAAATLRPHVKRIVGLSTFPEMGRIATSWLISAWTVVQNVHTVWDRAVGKKVSETRCGPTLPLVMKLSVAVRVKFALPQPTVIEAAPVYLLPKAILNGTRRLEPVVMADDKANGIALHMAQLGVILAGNRRKFAATAHAESAWIRSFFGSRFKSFVMMQVTKGLTLDFAPLGIGLSCNWRGLSTAAHAQAAGVWGVWNLAFQQMMAAKVAEGLSFSYPVASGSFARQGCLLPATAVAVSWLNCVKGQLGLGELWGMLLHVFSASNATDQAGELQLARHFLLGFTRVIVSQNTPI